jgi:hypothetical protein
VTKAKGQRTTKDEGRTKNQGQRTQDLTYTQEKTAVVGAGSGEYEQRPDFPAGDAAAAGRYDHPDRLHPLRRANENAIDLHVCRAKQD